MTSVFEIDQHFIDYSCMMTYCDFYVKQGQNTLCSSFCSKECSNIRSVGAGRFGALLGFCASTSVGVKKIVGYRFLLVGSASHKVMVMIRVSVR